VALPALLRCVAYGDIAHSVEVEREALVVLVQMGTLLLPRLVDMMRKSVDEAELVSDALESIGRVFWEHLHVDNPEISLILVQRLAQSPDEVMDFLLYVLGKPLKEWWEIAVLTISTIGYPKNAVAIPQLMWTASDPNVPGAREALDCLEAIEARAIALYFVAALFAPESDRRYPGWLNICSLLRCMDRRYLLPCGPALAHQIVVRGELKTWQVRNVLELLEEIGIDCAIYAMPALIEMIKQTKDTAITERTWHLMDSFPQEQLEPYSRVMASLRVR
jgi:hypothetical protein